MPVEKYTRAKELLAHSKQIGKKFDLYSRTLFQTEATAMKWDESKSVWSVETSRNDRISARFVVPAAGPLHRPKLPGLPGVESYKGHAFHSSRFDYNYTGGDPTGGLSKLSDKRVGIIGTGATAVQIVPHLGESAKQLYVFQRTPSSIDFRGQQAHRCRVEGIPTTRLAARAHGQLQRGCEWRLPRQRRSRCGRLD